jgi:hypothetical protein
MPYKLLFDVKVKEELDLTYRWYDDRVNGLGEKFITAVKARLGQIVITPELFKLTRSSYRETKVDKFPFLIIYKIYEKDKAILVTTVHHTSRNPKRKYRRHKRHVRKQ